MGAGMGAAGEGAMHALGGGHGPGGGGHGPGGGGHGPGGGGHEPGGGGHEPGGGGGHEPTDIQDLPEGSVIHNLSHDDAELAYQNAIADTPEREASIVEHFENGERMVVQGDNASVEMADDVEPEFGDENYGSRKHFHTLDPRTGLTPEESLYPSMEDMQGARTDARRARRPWRAEIEVVTPDGRQFVPYGCEPGAERPFWVHPPESLGGGAEPERFANLHEFMEWVERQHAIRRGATPAEAPPPPPRPPDPPPAREPAPRRVEDPEIDDFFAEQRERLNAPGDPVITDYEVPDDGAGSFSDLPTGEFTDEATIQEQRPDADDDPTLDFDDEPTQ
jgi:hypothetical protein